MPKSTLKPLILVRTESFAFSFRIAPIFLALARLFLVITDLNKKVLKIIA